MALVYCLGGSCSGNAFLLPSDGQPHCILHTQPRLLLLAVLLMDAGADVTQIVPRCGRNLLPAPLQKVTGDRAPPWSQFLTDRWLQVFQVLHPPRTAPLRRAPSCGREAAGCCFISLAEQMQNHSPAPASAAPRHSLRVPSLSAELRPGRGRFWKKASLPDVSSVAFKGRQSLLSAPGRLSRLLPSLPVPQGTRFLLSRVPGSRGSGDWQPGHPGAAGMAEDCFHSRCPLLICPTQPGW